jgi:hypothetical protein
MEVGMRKMLVGVATWAIAGLVSAQSYSFSMLSSVTNTIVGSGYAFQDAGSEQWNVGVAMFGHEGFRSNDPSQVVGFEEGVPASWYGGALVVNYFYTWDDPTQPLSQTEIQSISASGHTYVYNYNLAPGPGSMTFQDSGVFIFPHAVPEPGTYALLIGGLVLIGLARRGRERSVTSGC